MPRTGAPPAGQAATGELVRQVRERILNEGPMRVADFEYEGPKRGSWWDWKPAKTALEYLFAFGDLLIANRINFQRVYDLSERVLPGWVDTSEPSMEQRDRYWLDQAARALGISQPSQLIGYNFYKRGPVRAVLEAMMKPLERPTWAILWVARRIM